MKDFKFLDNDNDEMDYPEEWDGATWSYIRLEHLVQYRYEVVVEHHYGIRSFLNHFPNNFIVSILSITGPNEIRHSIDNYGIGWGFDITRDLIRVEWIRYFD